MGNYDHDWCGIGHPNHPANQPETETEPILVVCDWCEELTPEWDCIEDGDKYFCNACWAQFEFENPENRDSTNQINN